MSYELSRAIWHCEPKKHEIKDDKVTITTEPDTDFWQRTHAGYSADNAPAMLVPVSEGNFVFDVSVSYDYKELYDQAGIIIYYDEDNWFKASAENVEHTQKLGSVLTTFGYSDWACNDISQDTKEMHFRLTRKESDFTLEYSFDREEYFLIRMFHVFKAEGEIKLGFYACSPKQSSFTAKFKNICFQAE